MFLSQRLDIRHQVMDISIGVLGKQSDVGIYWRVDGVSDTADWPGMISPASIPQSHGKLIQICESARDCSTGRKRHGDFFFASLGYNMRSSSCSPR